MKKTIHSPVARILLLDLLLLNLINAFFVIRVKGYGFSGSPGNERYLFLLLLLNLLWVVFNLVVTRYKMEINRGIFQELKKIILNMLLFTSTVSVFAFMFKELRYSRVIIYGTLATFSVLLVASRLIALKLIKKWRRGKAVEKYALIVGNNRTALDIAASLLNVRDIKYSVTVFMDASYTPPKASDKEYRHIDIVTGQMGDAPEMFSKHKFDELFIAVTSPEEDQLKLLVETADYHGARVRMVPTFYKMFEHNFQVHLLDSIPVIDINEIPLDNFYNARYKRAFDIVFSLLALLLTLPLLLLIALLVKLTSRGPVLYVPIRVGVAGKRFKLYKFRTMIHTGENNDHRSTEPDDERLTAVGGFLRRWDLDELLQFVNVLKGEMSVVGPRPHRVYLDKVMQNSVENYMVRHYIKPGVTGWAQVNGWRGPTKTEEQKIQRTKHDLWYLRNWTFMLDLKIILLTVSGRKARKNAF
jgi:putative colanic acid biosynthesis UDP-glucose lipid carrier transferase